MESSIVFTQLDADVDAVDADDVETEAVDADDVEGEAVVVVDVLVVDDAVVGLATVVVVVTF